MSKKVLFSLVTFLTIMIVSMVVFELYSGWGWVLVFPLVSFFVLVFYLGALHCPKCGVLVLFSFDPYSLEIPVLSIITKHKCPNCGHDLG